MDSGGKTVMSHSMVVEAEGTKSITLFLSSILSLLLMNMKNKSAVSAPYQTARRKNMLSISI